jgi:CubicO group peptidase (beta-lactamase class C family)
MLLWATLLCLTAADPTVKAVDGLAAAALKAWNVPGAAVVIVRGEETLVLKGFGRRAFDRPEPVTADTIFPLASCSKAFTTTLLAMLVDEGKLDWDDPVQKHVPGFKLPDPHADALLTVRDLLCHRSGIGSHDLLWYRAPWGIDETIRRAQLLPLDYPFRDGFRYSSIPFLVAGRALERRSGESWENLIQSRIVKPLGMTGVSVASTAIPADADRAGGHRLGKGGKLEAMPAYEIREPNPAGSVNASARDLAAWLKFHLAKGVGPDGVRRVSARHLIETHTAQNLIPMRGSAKRMNPETVQLAYAMGWLVYDYRGRKVVSHGGMIDGFRVQITFLPEDGLGVAVLCNLHDSRLPMALTNNLVDHYGGLKPKDWNAYYRRVVNDETVERKRELDARHQTRDAAARPALPLASFAGTYTHAAYGTAVVNEADGKLSLKLGAFVCPLEHFEKETFRVTEGFFEEQLVTFVLEGKKVMALTFQGQTFKL